MAYTNDELARRVQNVEKNVEMLRRADEELKQTLAELNKTLALLNQSFIDLQAKEDARRSFSNKVVMFIIGSFVAAFMT